MVLDDNVIGSFIPAPMNVLNGFGNFMFLRSAVYWVLAVIVIIVTKGSLGYDNHFKSD